MAVEGHRAEERLRASERRLRNTLDNMLEGCQIIGPDWRYLYVNNAVAKHNITVAWSWHSGSWCAGSRRCIQRYVW